jgi:hypothetical protein
MNKLIIFGFAILIGCTGSTNNQTRVIDVPDYCDGSKLGVIESDLAIECANAGGTCQCVGATVNGTCDARVTCHVSNNQCKQYTGDVSVVCPNDKLFAISCYVAIENPGGVQCVAGNGESDTDPNVIWCCE